MGICNIASWCNGKLQIRVFKAQKQFHTYWNTNCFRFCAGKWKYRERAGNWQTWCYQPGNKADKPLTAVQTFVCQSQRAHCSFAYSYWFFYSPLSNMGLKTWADGDRESSPKKERGDSSSSQRACELWWNRKWCGNPQSRLFGDTDLISVNVPSSRTAVMSIGHILNYHLICKKNILVSAIATRSLYRHISFFIILASTQ